MKFQSFEEILTMIRDTCSADFIQETGISEVNV